MVRILGQESVAIIFAGRLAEEVPCEAGASFQNFARLQCNSRRFLHHRVELKETLRLLAAYPAIISLNETFLDNSVNDD